MPREFAFSLLFFATRTFSLRKQHFASVESLPDLRVGIPMQKMKFTTLFRCGCASGDNGSSGYFLEDKMESLKLQKLCGYIIYIKSVIATILASILFGSGIYYCTSLSRQKEDKVYAPVERNCTFPQFFHG